MSIVDLSPDAGDDLLGEGLVAVLTDGEGEHDGSRVAPLARPLDRYSYAD
jgi:hypothetical protein